MSDHEASWHPPSPEQLAAFELLIDVARTEHPLDAVPELVLQAVVAVFRPAVACVYVRSRSNGQYAAAARYPDAFWHDNSRSRAFLTWSEERGAVGRAFRDREPVYTEYVFQASERSDYVPFDGSVRSEIVIPVFAHDALVVHEVGIAAVVIAQGDTDTISSGDRWLARIIHENGRSAHERLVPAA